MFPPKKAVEKERCVEVPREAESGHVADGHPAQSCP